MRTNVKWSVSLLTIFVLHAGTSASSQPVTTVQDPEKKTRVYFINSDQVVDPQTRVPGTPPYIAAARRLAALLPQAEAGDVAAMLKIARLYDTGSGTDKNPPEEVRWLTKAADLGSPEAMSRLADFYLTGTVVGRDLARAVTLQRSAAAAGDPGALNNFALMFMDGQGVEKDPIRAEELFLQAGQKGEVSAMMNLVDLYGTDGPRRNDAEFRKWVRLAAEREVPDALYLVAVSYQQGARGFPVDERKALQFYRSAAERSHRSAMFNLGNYYFGSQGDRPDYAQAFYWFSKASALGHPKANHGLGEIYWDGLGVKKDRMKGREYFCLAASGGFVTDLNRDCVDRATSHDNKKPELISNNN